jgi:uncharacterized protein YqjF (DUF2071 family)
MSGDGAARLALLAALSAARRGLPRDELDRLLAGGGLEPAERAAALDGAAAAGHLAERDGRLELTQAGVLELLALHARIEAALDPSPDRPGLDDCPSLPWLTTVQTCWIDAVSINYAVDPTALQRLLPPPLAPEIWKGSAWVQVLMSSLRDLRPQGLGALFGVSFYQVSYRAAVTYSDGGGAPRRGGYFVRSETNHPVMRTVGNALSEFKFHDFGLAEMVMLRDGDRLVLGVEPEAARPGGRIFGKLDTRPLAAAPPGSVWGSLEELHEPLVECYDALGVDEEAGWLYVLTIDRDPWQARFVQPEQLYCEYFDSGALGGGAARLDSILHLRECAYRWRPLRRERLPRGRTPRS